MIDFAKLREPFAPSEVEWRVARAGKNDRGVWAAVLCYMTSRAVQERLDVVCGPGNWQVHFRGEGHSLSCGIGIRLDDEWVWKWDGAGFMAPNDGLSSDEAGKGDYSQAMKRAAVQWGIGRYLYDLPEGWANVHANGTHYGKTKDGTGFKWDPPELPAWAVPGGSGKPEPGQREKVDPATGEVTEDEPARNGGPSKSMVCPSCNASEVWDNRAKKASGKMKANAPDYSCKDRDGCSWALWLDGAVKKIGDALDVLHGRGVITDEQKQHILKGVASGELDALQKAQEWIRDKAEEPAPV